MRIATIAAALLAATPAAADLGDEPQVVERVIQIGIAYELQKVCPDLEARKVRGLRELLATRGVASGLGYSRAEIDAWIDDDAEKDRLEGVARARLAALGARQGDVQAHCAVGREQIAQGSYIGSLLRD